MNKDNIDTIRMTISLILMVFAGVYIDTFIGVIFSLIGTINAFDMIKKRSMKYYE